MVVLLRRVILMYNIRLYNKDGSIEEYAHISDIKKRKRTLEFTLLGETEKYRLNTIKGYLYF